MGEDYKFDEMPASFNAWLTFRHLVDIVLAFDLVSYTVFCLAYFEWPGLSFTLILAYLFGSFLCIFTVWAKTDAYRVVKDFAWCKIIIFSTNIYLFFRLGRFFLLD
jgi:phosphatidylethanolamine N-methyltransferase